MTETIRERFARHQVTQTMEVHLAAALDHARALVVSTFTETWMSSGGCQYRRNGPARQMAYVKARTACDFLADYVLHPRTTDSLMSELTEEAVTLGELIREGNRALYPPHEADADYVAALPVRSQS